MKLILALFCLLKFIVYCTKKQNVDKYFALNNTIKYTISKSHMIVFCSIGLQKHGGTKIYSDEITGILKIKSNTCAPRSDNSTKGENHITSSGFKFILEIITLLVSIYL